jgi:hypothetical protein
MKSVRILAVILLVFLAFTVPAFGHGCRHHGCCECGVPRGLRAGTTTTLARLAPAGFLTANGVRLKEGEELWLRCYRVSTVEGDLLIATELGKDGKTVTLRNRRGRPVWQAVQFRGRPARSR